MIEISAVIGKGCVKDFGVAYIATIPGLNGCHAYAKSLREVESCIEYALESWLEKRREISIEDINNNLPSGMYISTHADYQTKVIMHQEVDHKQKLPAWAMYSWLLMVFFSFDIFSSDKGIGEKFSTAFSLIGTIFFLYLVAVTASWIYHKLKKH